jgi:hypothetical protein
LFDDTCHYPATPPTNNDKPIVPAKTPAPPAEPQSHQQTHLQLVGILDGEAEPLTVRQRSR